MSYQQRLNRHLEDYCRSRLGISEPGLFRYRGRDLLYGHILPAEQWPLNLLDRARPFTEALFTRSPKSRHRYFHHLNSSQAFALNLFAPFFEGDTASSQALLRAVASEGELKSWSPEAIPDPDEGTNVDVLWVTDRGTTICEVKLSESSFGTARADEAHVTKITLSYAPRLKGYVSDRLLDPATFVKSYQVLRNIWHLVGLENARLVFLLPRANDAPWQELRRIMQEVSRGTQERISVVAVEDVLDALVHDAQLDVQMREYAQLLKEKYVPTSVT